MIMPSKGKVMNNDWEKDEHLTNDEMLSLLDRIGPHGIKRAIAAWKKGKRPSIRFGQARSWLVEGCAHRPLISLACEMCSERELKPINFGLRNDNNCKDWFVSHDFKIESAS